jgi:hypothetical protein
MTMRPTVLAAAIRVARDGNYWGSMVHPLARTK